MRTLDQLPAALPDSPMPLVDEWLQEVNDLGIQPNPNAMTIVSVASDGGPSARIVLCKAFVPDPGYLVFYTNYRSRKGSEFSANKNAAALFHWDPLGRQIRIGGIVVRSPEAESDAYFASRDWGSQLGAWGSDQSSPIESKDALVAQIHARAKDLGLSLDSGTESIATDEIPKIDRPPHWGGFRLWAKSVELWVEGKDRIHDRGYWSRDIDVLADNRVETSAWNSTRLQP